MKDALISLGENKFDVEWEPNVKQEDWLKHISRVKPQIIHFCGHATKEGLIVDDAGKVLLNEYLENLLKEFADRVECVILNACDTEPLAEALAKHINYAIGMNRPVNDRSAIHFAKYFYGQLGIGNPIETAFNLAINEVFRITSPSPHQSESSLSSDSQDRKLTVVDPDGNPVKSQNREHLIPVLKINPNPTKIKSLWLSPEEEKEALSQLLTAIDDAFNKIKLFHSPEEIILKDQYIPIQVTLERRYQDKLETIGSYTESEEEFKKAYALKGMGEEEIKRQQEDWAIAKQKESRIIVLADPGMGKSTLLRMEVCQAVEQSKRDLEAGKAIDSLIIPLFVRLSSLADLCANDNENDNLTIRKAVRKIIQDRHEKLLKKSDETEKATTFLNDFLDKQLEDGKCLLLLDALDEVPQEKRPKLLEKLTDFVRNYPNCRIVATSRIVGYGGKLIDSGKEMEIVPFTQDKTEKYIKTWFNNAEKSLKDNSVTPQGLIQALKERPQLSGLAQNPLLLSLICSLYQQDKLTLPARRGQIYEKSVQCMLKEWAKNRPEHHDERVEAKIRLLEALAYHFSSQEKEVFDYGELYDWLEEYLEEDAPRDLRDDKTGELIAELSAEDGILQKLYRDREDTQYLFLHRTFQEYFTASYLSRRIRKNESEGIALVKPYFWDYDWHETISLLAGLLKKPMVLIEAIMGEKDDIFHTQLLLAGRCLGECRAISHPLVDEIIEGIWQFLLRYPEAKFMFIASVVMIIGQVYKKTVELFIDVLKDNKYSYVRDYAVAALIKIGNKKAVEALIEAFKDEDSYVKRYAAEALVKIGNEKALEALIESLKDEDSKIRYYAALALGKMGNEKAVAALIEALQDEDRYVRRTAAAALGKIGSLTILKKLLQSPDIDLYAPDNFALARKLAIKFSKESHPLIPVYPESVRKARTKD